MYKTKTVYTSQKRELSSLEPPLKALATEYYSSEDPSTVETFLKDYGIKYKSSWFFPQMLAKIAECTLQKNSSGLISAKMLYDNYLSKDPILYALLTLAQYPTRSHMIEIQTKEPELCSLVPLILAAFKKYKNINYSSWDKDEIHLVVEGELLKAMRCVVPELTKEEILDARGVGLTIKTGVNAGGIRPATSTYNLYLPHSSPLYELPKLAKVMICQTWCAHPNTRNQ